jgi:uncharacterized protein (DUF58 family)
MHLPALHAWTHDPLGLFAVPVAATHPLAVVVHPPPAAPPVHGPAVSDASPAGGETTGPAEPWWAPGGCGDFTDLRPYVPGDRLHLLDWQALARYDRLMVRRFDPEVSLATRLILDDRAGVHRRASFEELLSVLLGLVASAVDHGRPVELWTLSGLRFMVAPTPAGLAAFLPVAAVLDPRHRPGTLPGPALAGADVLGRVPVLTTPTGAERLPAVQRPAARVGVSG